MKLESLGCMPLLLGNMAQGGGTHDSFFGSFTVYKSLSSILGIFLWPFSSFGFAVSCPAVDDLFVGSDFLRILKTCNR